MKKIKDLDKYLLFDNKKQQIIYNNTEDMIVTIPSYFKDRKYFGTDSDSGNTIFLGIALIIIGNKSCVLNIPSLLETIPTNIIDKDDFITMNYKKGDIFIVNNYIVQSSIDVYGLFTSFVTLGKPIPYISYTDFISIFDNMQLLAGKNFGTRIDYELLIAESTRSLKDLNVKYRNTKMDKPFKRISMRNIAYGPQSVTSKIVGSYFNDGLVSSLLVEDDGKPASKIEALLKS